MKSELSQFKKLVKKLKPEVEDLDEIVLVSFRGKPRLRKKKNEVRQLVVEFIFDKKTKKLDAVEVWDYYQPIRDMNEMDKLLVIETGKRKEVINGKSNN